MSCPYETRRRQNHKHIQHTNIKHIARHSLPSETHRNDGGSSCFYRAVCKGNSQLSLPITSTNLWPFLSLLLNSKLYAFELSYKVPVGKFRGVESSSNKKLSSQTHRISHWANFIIFYIFPSQKPFRIKLSPLEIVFVGSSNVPPFSNHFFFASRLWHATPQVYDWLRAKTAEDWTFRLAENVWIMSLLMIF